MKKLLFVINEFNKGGAETSLLNLLKLLDKDRYAIDLIVTNQTESENTVSLINQLPKGVHVLDACRAQKLMPPWDRLRSRGLLTQEERSSIPGCALLYVKDREYDWAFHVGEWWLPEFVATHVRARHKCAWLHTDISEADSFDGDAFFQYDEFFDWYLFVSNNSMKSSLKRYPFMGKKPRVIYNISDVDAIRAAAEEPVQEDYFDRGLPVVLTLANVREEKGHQRSLEAMGILKQRGLDFLWVNVGSTTETDRCDDLMYLAENLNVKDNYILAGPRNNPYPYLKRADIVVVPSDYESWSMVITEAKILGKPILSTNTSGALEQIEDGKNGFLTDFNAGDIADKLEVLLTSPELRETFSNNLKGFNNDAILGDFDDLVAEKGGAANRKEMLYIIDEVNYIGGAHMATKMQIRALLKKGVQIDIFSGNLPSVRTRNELIGARFLSFRDFPENDLYQRRILSCLFDSDLTQEQKKYKLAMTYRSKIKRDPNLYQEMVMPHIKQLFSGYRTVCVMSEGSGYRKYAAEADSAWKVQWIHTDYSSWRGFSKWTRDLTRNDLEIYRKFDRIVLLSDRIRQKFVELYPELESKAVVNPNLMPVDEIRKKASMNCAAQGMRFVTVGRFSPEKAYDRLFRVLCRLTEAGYTYHWTLVGGGELLEKMKELYQRSIVRDYVTFTGMMENPYPLMKDADVFALFSTYEGLPNTIYESLILGVPVIATDVGGIANQISDGINGWLADDDEEQIYQKLTWLLDNPQVVEQAKKNLVNYTYENDRVLSTAQEILCPGELWQA